MPSQPPHPDSSPGADPFSVNPYAPTVETADPTANDVEAFRRKHLSHEASIKSMGFLFYLGAVMTLPVGVLILFQTLAPGAAPVDALLGGIGVFYLGLGLLQAYGGYGLRRLQPGGRVAGILLSCFGLLVFPVVTIISMYFLFLLASSKGSVVFSEEYKEVIRKTPHIRYTTSAIVWIFVGLLVIVFAFGALSFVFVGGA